MVATSTFYEIPLIGEGSQDWSANLDRAISRLSSLIAVNQKPTNVNLKWGDITNGRYLETNTIGLQLRGDVNYSLGLAKNFRIDGGVSFPGVTAAGHLFYRTDESTLYFRTASAWVPIAVVTDGAIRTAGGLVGTDFGFYSDDNLGRIPVVLENGDPGTVNPFGNSGRVMVADPDEPTGWRFADISTELAKGFPSRGAVHVGAGVGVGQIVEAPSDEGLHVFVTDESEIDGARWAQSSEVAAAPFSTRGQLMAGSGVRSGVVVPPPSSGQVLLGDADAEGGMRWGDQSELGSVPSAGQAARANVFSNMHFF